MLPHYMLGPVEYEQVLSAYGRKISTSSKRIVREVRTADGSLKRDIIATKRTWKIDYSRIPDNQGDVDDYDGMGRNDLYDLYLRSDTLSFHVPQDDADESWEDAAVVFGAESWQEDLLHRELSKRIWKLSFVLEEV
jgi:hypothetical protein